LEQSLRSPLASWTCTLPGASGHRRVAMRGHFAWGLALLLGLAVQTFADESGAGVAAATDPDGSDLDLDEDDLDDFEDESEDSAGRGAAMEDFDLEMPEEQRKTRMRACYAHTVHRAQTYQDQLQAAIQQMVEANSGQQRTQDQAANSVIFSWMITCYMNINDHGIKAAVAGTPLQPEVEQDIFSHHPEKRQQANQASQRQWQLLELVLMEQQSAQQQRQGMDPRTGPGAPGVAGSSMTGQSQMLYILVVFGIIFGVGAIVVLRLMRGESQDRDKLTKSQKKADKAEKKLARKQR